MSVAGASRVGTMSQLWVGHATTNVARRHDSTKGPGATFAAWAHQGVTLVGPLERVSGRGLADGRCGPADGVSRKVALRHERRHRGARAPEPITAPGLIAPTRASLADRACAPLGGAPVAQCILVVVVLGLAVVGRGASKVLSLGETPRDDSCSAGVHKLGGQASCRSGGGRSRSRAPQACRGLLGGQRYPERQHSEQHTGHGAHTACEALSALRAGGPPQDRSP